MQLIRYNASVLIFAFVALGLSALGVVYLVSDKTQLDTDAAIAKVQADYDRSMVNLCKTYRKWQALPNIANKQTDMDAVCSQIEAGQK